jgi:hypothetical protein
MDGKGTEKACTLLSLTSSQSLHVDGPSEVREKGSLADSSIIKSLESRLAGYLHNFPEMGESGAVNGESNAVTERYNSNHALTVSSNGRGADLLPSPGADRDRKMTVRRRYKYSQLEWYKIGGRAHRKENNFSEQRRLCASPDKTPQALGMTEHVKTELDCSLTSEPCYYPYHDGGSTASITTGSTGKVPSTDQFLTVSRAATVPFQTLTKVMSGPYAPSSQTLQPSFCHSCSVCGEQFLSYELLSRHISSHVQAASRPAVHCPFCNDTFSDPVAFFDHTATHVDDNPFATAASIEKMEVISKQSLESTGSLIKRDASLVEVLDSWQPTSGRRKQSNNDVETHETTKLQEQQETEKGPSITLRTFHNGRAAPRDQSADSGFSSPDATAAYQNAAPSPSFSYTVTPSTPSHSVTKTHFCFTGLAVGAMSSVEPSYTPPSTTELASINPGSATPSNVFDLGLSSNGPQSLRTSTQALPSPVMERCANSQAHQPATPETDSQDMHQSLDNQSPCNFSIEDEDRENSPHETPPRRRRRRQSNLSNVSDDQSEDSTDICQIKFVPSHSKGDSQSSSCLQLPRDQAVSASAPASRNVCSTCGKSFRLRAYLRIHQRLHTGDLPYPCHVCGKKFNQSWNRNVHMRVHSGINPHRCKLCCKNFRSSIRLREHLTVIHALSESEITERMKIAAIEDMANEMHGRQGLT